jgi:integrase
MARPSSLEPRYLESRDKWVLNVPAELSDTGKRRQLFFATKRAASADVEKLKARSDNFGTSLSTLTPARIAKAAEAYKLLDPLSIDLLDAVRGYVAAYKQRTESISFLELFNVFVEAKKDRNPRYLGELRYTRDRFPQLHDRLVSDLTHRDLEPLLLAISPGGRNPVMRYLRAVFNYGVKRGYLLENPISRLDFAERPRKEVETVTNDQVKAMLSHSMTDDLELLPFLILGLFCGIRPDGELQKIEWRDIDLNDKVVTIRPEVSKTKRRRFVDLSANAKAWLEAFITQAGIQQGRIATYNPSELRTHRRTNWQAAGILKWPQQAMRHTYCSNWLAMHQDINKLVLQSGHDSVDTMWRHYHRGVTRAEAATFWKIRPPKTAKIVPIENTVTA